MILVDVNLLVYAYTTTMTEHEAARQWLDAQLGSTTQVALPWESTTAFARIVSNGRIWPTARSLEEAWDQVEAWLAEPNVWVPAPTRQHSEIMGEFCRSEMFTSQDLPDIHLAALAISHGLKLASHDQGFARFEGLRWIDPLAA